jgi:hypothetical protein
MKVEVLVRDVVKKRVHVRYRREGVRGLWGHEDERDSSGAYEVLTEAEAENVPADELCTRCFGEGRHDQ